ncbi:MAG: hypothetical protein IKX23_00560 [Treponema sp.]|nr:hypothetical protein [Treponema sp.]
MNNKKEFGERLLKDLRRSQEWSYPAREYENVEVFISVLGKTYRYYMTNNGRLLMKKLAEHNYKMPAFRDFKKNPFLAQEVRKKMIELAVSYSFEDDQGHLINYFAPWCDPLICRLR